MNQSHFKALARQFMGNTIGVKAGDNVWIEYIGPTARKIAEASALFVRSACANPFLVDRSSDIINTHPQLRSPEGITDFAAEMMSKMQRMQGYIRIKDDADEAKRNWSADLRSQFLRAMYPVTEYRLSHTRWLVVAAPTKEFAADCGMTLRTFEQFYRDVCLLDYTAMTQAAAPLQQIMTEGKQVHIYSPSQNTDLTFSIEGFPAIPCTGTFNIPDGECFTAPIKDSINGTIQFGASRYNGQRFASIALKFKDGRIVDAVAENAERTKVLNVILDTDETARYVGEFAINFNPYVQHPTGSILFDEKIDGGLHLAAGCSYDEAFNGNKSAVHWDMVHIQRPDYGGGEIWIDDRLIRKDGIFTVPELFPLNPENLKAASAKLRAPIKTPQLG